GSYRIVEGRSTRSTRKPVRSQWFDAVSICAAPVGDGALFRPRTHSCSKRSTCQVLTWCQMICPSSEYHCRDPRQHEKFSSLPHDGEQHLSNQEGILIAHEQLMLRVTWLGAAPCSPTPLHIGTRSRSPLSYFLSARWPRSGVWSVTKIHKNFVNLLRCNSK